MRGTPAVFVAGIEHSIRNQIDECESESACYLDDEIVQEIAHVAARTALRVTLRDLHAMLFPEQHPGYDPDHLYWQDGGTQACFMWSADTIEWVADWCEALRRVVGE